jgi:hypothetical protein
MLFDKASIRFVTVRSAQTRQIASRGRASSRHIGTWTRHFPTGLGSPPRSRLPPASDPATNVRRRSLRRLFLPPASDPATARARLRSPAALQVSLPRPPPTPCGSPYHASCRQGLCAPRRGHPTAPRRAAPGRAAECSDSPAPGPPYSPSSSGTAPRRYLLESTADGNRWKYLVWAAVARALVEACNIFFPPAERAFHLLTALA